jgi:hypothetical protein
MDPGAGRAPRADGLAALRAAEHGPRPPPSGPTGHRHPPLIGRPSGDGISRPAASTRWRPVRIGRGVPDATSRRKRRAPERRPPLRGSSRFQWTRPALPRRPKAFPHQLLRAQSVVRISRGASPPTNRSPARHSCDLTRRPSAAAAGPGSLTDTGDPPYDPKGGRWLSVLLFRQRERASESCPQLHWFPVGDAVLRVRGSLTDAVPLRRNWIGPVDST